MYRKHQCFVAAVVVALLATCNLASSQDSALQQGKPGAQSGKSVPVDDIQGQSDQDISLLRKELRSERKQIVAANMNLTDGEAEKFWPVYDQYAADLAKINDTKAALLKDYLQTVDTMNSEESESYLRKRAEIEESTIQLRLRYLDAFRKVLSGRQTARFFQIDWRLGLMIDLQLAQMPMIDP